MSPGVRGSFQADRRILGRFSVLEENPETGFDLWTLPLELTDPARPKAGKPEVFLRTPAGEIRPSFCPDGRWIAYGSNESGNDEIYVRPFRAGSAKKWPISSGGGSVAFWSNNNRELFYRTPDLRIMVVDYTANGDSFVAGKPRLWSERPFFDPGVPNLDLAPDGKRFAVLTLPEAAGGEKGSVHVTMLQNFFDEVKRRIP
jgi:serine/threonine-protein kinase